MNRSVDANLDVFWLRKLRIAHQPGRLCDFHPFLLLLPWEALEGRQPSFFAAWSIVYPCASSRVSDANFRFLRALPPPTQHSRVKGRRMDSQALPPLTSAPTPHPRPPIGLICLSCVRP
jgi:hypothetical protein